MGPMKILAWVAVPLVVTLVAWIVYRVANRPSAPLTPKESMQAHERFLQVLETPVPAPQQSRRAAAASRARQGTRR
jgi:hypothetical protein